MPNLHIADTSNHTDARPTRDSDIAPVNRDATPVALTTRELAMLVERQSRQIADLLAVVTAERNNTPVQWPRRSAEPQPRELILAALVDADGKPSHMTTTALQTATGLGKSSVHHHVNQLLDAGLVVVIKGKRLANGKRGPDVVYHADAIAV